MLSFMCLILHMYDRVTRVHGTRIKNLGKHETTIYSSSKQAALQEGFCYKYSREDTFE